VKTAPSKGVVHYSDGNGFDKALCLKENQYLDLCSLYSWHTRIDVTARPASSLQ